MSDTEIRGPCGHNCLDFAGFAVGALDDGDEFRALDALADACGICWAELMEVIRVIALLDERFAARSGSSGPSSGPAGTRGRRAGAAVIQPRPQPSAGRR